MKIQDRILFKDKKLSDLMNEIYNTKNKNSTEILSIVAELKNKLSKGKISPDEAYAQMKNFLEISLRNDEQLIKLATLSQRILLEEMKLESKVDEEITDEELKRIRDQVKEDLAETGNAVNDIMSDLNKQKGE